VTRFIHEDGFDLKLGKARELQQWLVNNEEKLRASCPDGVEYLGAYAVVQTSEKGAGEVRVHWGMDNYAAQDAFSGAMYEPGVFRDLVDELYKFADYEARRDHFSRTVLKSVTATSFWGDM
jgi:hypothetical protein